MEFDEMIGDDDDLFNWGDQNWRHDNPQTSRLAGERATAQFAASHAGIIYRVMKRLNRPLAVEEIQQALNGQLDKYQINKRMSELRDKYRLIEQMPDLPENYYYNRTGSPALRWRLLGVPNVRR
jgi:hypothetical protein